VTGVDSTGKLDMLRSIGADEVVDYTSDNYTKSDASYDFILDVVNTGSALSSTGSLNQNGRYLVANPGLSLMVRARWTNLASSKKVIAGKAFYKTEDLIYLKELIEAGKVRSVIDRRYPLERAADAHRYVETGHKTGHVVLIVN
jgi:NADPH:quinone reductase-like Zn-dependent oxidoreductase